MRTTLKTFVFICLNLYPAIQCDTFLVFGGRGWIGQQIVKLLQDRGHAVYCATSRLENREAIERELQTIKPDYIINAAGVTGRPNVDWCESHNQETIRANVLGVLNLVDIAFLHNIHVTNLASGCIYNYDQGHTLENKRGFTEEENPNFTGSFYSYTKVVSEDLILNYPNVLNLRLRMPISSDLHPRSFVGKIIHYKKLVNIPNSMSVLDDLLPLIPTMIERKLTGAYNFVNPGTVSHNQIMELYKKYVNPNHKYENFSLEEQSKILAAPRSNCELSADKLLKEFPNLPNIQDSIVKIFLAMQQRETLDV
jgi:nucleoside-diphosphate-sugar epimerase